MKKPSIKDLKPDAAETRRVRSAMARQRTVKITININAETLAKMKAIADESGVPYQRLINRALTESLANRAAESSRLDRLEKELATLKRKIAA